MEYILPNHPCRVQTFDCYDWTERPDGVIDFFKDLDEEDNEHVEPFFSLGKDAYVSIYEYPKVEDDMPIFLRVRPIR